MGQHTMALGLIHKQFEESQFPPREGGGSDDSTLSSTVEVR